MLEAKPVVVVDTNALFQAMQNDRRYIREKYGGRFIDGTIDKQADEFAPARLFAMLQTKSVVLATSGHIIAEIMRLLPLHRGLRPDETREGWFRQLQDILDGAIRVEPREHLSVVRDPDDDRIIECALAADAQYIVTEDKDLLSLGTYAGIAIMRMRDFVKHIEGS